jgi:Mg2+/Co2+ transporter CorB
METQILLTFGTIAILLVLSAFFSGSETALTPASPARMHTLEQQGDSRARVVNALFSHKDRLIGAVLLGNNLVNILASALATSLLIGLAGETGVVYATLAMTTLVLIFAEVLPKTYAIHNADRVALTVARTMQVVVQAFAPVTVAVQWIVRSTLSLFGVRSRKR